MKTLFYTVALAVVLVLTMWFNYANATGIQTKGKPLYSMRLISKGPKNAVVDIVGVMNRGGDTILVVDACGSLLEFSTAKKHFTDNAFQDFVVEYIKKVCE